MSLIVLVGESSSGKSLFEKELVKRYNFKSILKYTTRHMREDEKDGIDYNFIQLEKFKKMIDKNLFFEYEEYSQNRFYGTIKHDYEHAILDYDNDVVVVLTPNGFRKLKKMYGNKVIGIYITAPLGVRVKRYINRCGENKFNFDDMNEINARVNRDYGMFLGIEKETNFTVVNDGNKPIEELLSTIKYFINLLKNHQ